MSKKYVIDLPDDAQYILINGASENHCYTRVEQVDDLEELNSDYINEHYGELQDEAYQKGINDGSLDVKLRAEGAYQRGLDDAWEAARRIVVDTDHGGLALGTLSEIFGTQSYSYIMRENTAQEAIDKIKAYDNVKHSNRIEVGDEVRNKVNGLIYIVTLASECGYVLLDSGGNCATSCVTNSFEKTGKHYDIQSILEAMQNVKGEDNA